MENKTIAELLHELNVMFEKEGSEGFSYEIKSTSTLALKFLSRALSEATLSSDYEIDSRRVFVRIFGMITSEIISREATFSHEESELDKLLNNAVDLTYHS